MADAGAPDTLELDTGARRRPGSSFALDKRVKYAPWLQGPLTQRHLIINGRPLLDLVGEINPHVTDVVSLLDDTWPDSEIQFIRQITGRARRDVEYDALEPGRLPLYGCAECLDIQCGALTALVERSADGATVRWSDLRWEDTYTPHEEIADLSALGPFTFDAQRYDALLTGLLPELRDAVQREAQARADWKAGRARSVRLRGLLGLDDSAARARARRRAQMRESCATCGHQWREHGAGGDTCSECTYEIQHEDPTAPAAPCTQGAPDAGEPA